MLTLVAKSIVLLLLGSLFLMALLIGYAADTLTTRCVKSPRTDRFARNCDRIDRS